MFSSSIFACPSAIINDVQPIIVLWLVTTASASDLRPGASFRLRAAPGREPHNRWGHGRGASPASDGRADSPCQASSPGRHVGGRINKHHQHRPTSAVGRPTAAPSASDPWGEFPTSSARRKARGASALPVNEGLPTVTGGERAGPAGIRCSGRPRPTLGPPPEPTPPGTLTLSIKLPPWRGSAACVERGAHNTHVAVPSRVAL